MWMRHAIALVGLLGSMSAAFAQDFRIEDVPSARNLDLAQLKPGVIAFSDHDADASGDAATNLIAFDEWARIRPAQKKFLSLYPGYIEPTVTRPAGSSHAGTMVEKLTMYVAQARFLLDRPPGSLDLSRYVTLAFLEKIDPAIKHRVLAPADINPFKDVQGTGNDNPERKWCTGRAGLICIQSSYRLEGRIPLGIMLVNKLRDTPKKVSDQIEFQSELSQVARSRPRPGGAQGS